MKPLGETRLFHPLSASTPGIRRIAVIGASLAYGAGVVPDHTLPAHLENRLNAESLGEFFEVANLARNASNLWHAWSTFQYHCADLGFDAVVLTICNNDTKMFDSIVPARSTERPWDGTYQFEVARKTFKCIRQFSESRQIPAIVAFYTLAWSDADYVAAAARACAEAGLPFVDLRSYLQDTLGSLDSRHFASEFDGHPSTLTHATAAARVAAEILAHARLAPLAGETDLAATAERLTLQMQSQGRDIDESLGWGRRTLAAKEMAWRGLVSKPAGVRLGRSDDVLGRLGAHSAVWRRHREIAAAFHGLGRAELDAVWNRLDNYYAHIKELDEYLFYLDSGVIADHTAEVEDHLADPCAAYRGVIAQLRPELIVQARRKTAEVVALLAPPDLDLQVPGRPHPLAAVHCELTRQFARQLERLSCLLPERIVDYSRLDLIALLRIHWAANYLNRIWSDLEVAPLDRMESADAFTSIDVKLEAQDGVETSTAVGKLHVTVDAIEPLRRRFIEANHFSLDRRRHVYHFEMPYFARGNVHVEVPPHSPGHDRLMDGRLTLSGIRVYHGGQILPGERGAWWKQAPDVRTASVKLRAVRPNVDGQIRDRQQLDSLQSRGVNLFAKGRRLETAHWTPIRSKVDRSRNPRLPGVRRAAKLVEDREPRNSHDVRRDFSIEGGWYALSFLARADERSALWIWLGDVNAPNRAEARFDLLRGRLEDVGTSSGRVTAVEGDMIAMADGWWWCWLAAQFSQPERGQAVIALADATGQMYYDGDGRSGAWLRAIRLEASERPTLDL
jgi:hypothetical protein